jgi:ubiquitin-like modifier-activating enzyme ATG7
MDPKRRIAEARELNNNLMRWRVAEGLDLDIIRNANVTILGMGTLGCGVVRTLMVLHTSISIFKGYSDL